MPINKRPDLIVEDTSGLTDADWAEINQLRRANQRGDKAFTAALTNLCARDFDRMLKVMFALNPSEAREALKDILVELGYEEEDLKWVIVKVQRSRN